MKKTIIAFAATVAAVQVGTAMPTQIQTTSPGTTLVHPSEEFTFEYRVGDIRVILLSEGQGSGNTGVLVEAPADVARYLSPEGTFPNATNAFVVASPRETILFDAGVGRRLADNLTAVGVSAPDVIYLTHMHGDHIGGLLTAGAKAFPNASLRLSAGEAAHWTAQQGDAKTVLDLYKPQAVELYTLENLPTGRDGVFAIEAPGHTPGHTVFLLVWGDARLLIWGDITHAMAVQMPRPEVSVRYDSDPDTARESRMKILEWVAANRIPVAGMHIPFPGIGMVEKAAEGYKFIPVAH